MFRNKTQKTTLFISCCFLLPLDHSVAFAEAPGKPGIGGQVFGHGRYKPAPCVVVFAVPKDNGFWAPKSRDNHGDIKSWDQVIDLLKRYPDGSVVQIMVVGHGNDDGGVQSE